MDNQTKIFNPKSSIIHRIDNEKYTRLECPWHYTETCLILNEDQQQYHCLSDVSTRSLRYKYYKQTKSCDIPEHFYDLIILNARLKAKYVLPFVKHFRIATGETIGQFQIQPPVYSASIIKPIHLAETFLTFLVLFCETCYRLGGTVPVLYYMKFVYSQTHPILVDIHTSNALRRNQTKFEEIFSVKKWKKFLTTRTSRDILHYMRLVHYIYFKKKKRRSTNCLLTDTIVFDDNTHNLICKNKKTNLYELLVKYKSHVPSLTVHIQRILNSLEELNKEGISYC